ncbi:MAG: MipA/OmpV family protein, partial [Spirochaetales bacterium]|nr:MipA/OmpV family protein [Spirochaetales bacterium]
MARGSASAVTTALFAAVCIVASPRPVGAESDRRTQEGRWDVSLGAGSMYRPVYDGADEMELRALPMVNI